MNTKYLNPCNDVAFKALFGSEDHKDLLISFLNGVLDLDGQHAIETVEFLSPMQIPKFEGYKLSIVDVLCHDQRGVHYIVEMQISRNPDFVKRAQYYAARAYTGQLKAAERYPQLNQVVFLAIADHIIFPNKKHYKSVHRTVDLATQENDLQAFRFTFIELPKFKKTDIDTLNTIEEKWLYFLRYADHEKEMPDLFKGTAIEEAYITLDRFNWSDKEIIGYDDASLAIVDYEGTVKFAKEEGREEGIIITAKNLLQAGASADLIKTATGLSESAIFELQAELELT